MRISTYESPFVLFYSCGTDLKKRREKAYLPSGLQSLACGFDFKQNLEKGALPSGPGLRLQSETGKAGSAQELAKPDLGLCCRTEHGEGGST
jgi:hypothetical protein